MEVIKFGGYIFVKDKIRVVYIDENNPNTLMFDIEGAKQLYGIKYKNRDELLSDFDFVHSSLNGEKESSIDNT